MIIFGELFHKIRTKAQLMGGIRYVSKSRPKSKHGTACLKGIRTCEDNLLSRVKLLMIQNRLCSLWVKQMYTFYANDVCLYVKSLVHHRSQVYCNFCISKGPNILATLAAQRTALPNHSRFYHDVRGVTSVLVGQRCSISDESVQSIFEPLHEATRMAFEGDLKRFSKRAPFDLPSHAE